MQARMEAQQTSIPRRYSFGDYKPPARSLEFKRAWAKVPVGVFMPR